MKNQRAPYFWVPSLYLAQGLPFFAVMQLTQYMLQDRGMAMDDITHWTAAIGLA
jgi:PAT family beta-lactamase induction signal transducer AmpG